MPWNYGFTVSSDSFRKWSPLVSTSHLCIFVAARRLDSNAIFLFSILWRFSYEILGNHLPSQLLFWVGWGFQMLINLRVNQVHSTPEVRLLYRKPHKNTPYCLRNYTYVHWGQSCLTISLMVLVNYDGVFKTSNVFLRNYTSIHWGLSCLKISLTVLVNYEGVSKISGGFPKFPLTRQCWSL